MKDWAQTFGVAVRQCAWQNLELSRRTSIRQKFSRVNRSASKSLTLRSSKKKQKNRRRRKWDIRVQFPRSDEESDESFPDNETACDDGPSIFGTRDSFSPRKIFPTWEEVFASTAELCSIDFFLYFPFYGSNVIAVTFFCFMHLFVSLILTCLYYYVFPRPKFNGRKSLPWLA